MIDWMIDWACGLNITLIYMKSPQNAFSELAPHTHHIARCRMPAISPALSQRMGYSVKCIEDLIAITKGKQSQISTAITQACVLDRF